MRILAVQPGPAFSVADVHRGWVKAFRRLGCEIVDFNLADRLTFYETAGLLTSEGEFRKLLDTEAAVALAGKGLLSACYEFWPDMLFLTSDFFISSSTLDTIRARRTKVVILHTESPYEDGRQLVRAEHADLNLVNDPLNLDRYQALGPAYYSPHCYDPDIHHPGCVGPDAKSDFCFVGTGYTSRIAFLEQIDWTGIDVALGGQWQALDTNSPLASFVCHPIEHCLDNEHTADLYRGAKVSANLYRVEADQPELAAGWACGPREVELAACRAFFLRQSRPESDQLFAKLPTFDGPAEFEDKLRWYLARPGERAEAAHAAWEAIEDRTFKQSAAGLLRAVDKL